MGAQSDLVSVVLSKRFLAQTGNGYGLAGLAEVLEEVQSGAKAFLGERAVNESAAAEEMMTAEPGKLSKGRQKLEVH